MDDKVYRVIQSEVLTELAKATSDMIKSGKWEAQGGISAVLDPQRSKIIYHQAICKINPTK